MNSSRHNFTTGYPTRPVTHEPRTAVAPLPPGVRTVDSRSLFLGAHEIGIEHKGSLYRLKITRQGKLILNK